MPIYKQEKQQQSSQGHPYHWRWLIVFGIFLALAVASIIWILNDKESFYTILATIIFSMIGIIIGLFQWLFPLPSNDSDPQVSSIQIGSPPETSRTSSLYSGQRIIIGIIPPTNPISIQQREQTVKNVYKQLAEQHTTAIALTGIGGVGKSTLAALVYHYSEQQRLKKLGPFTGETIWLSIDNAMTLLELVSTLSLVLHKPLPDLERLAPTNLAVILFNLLNKLEKPRLIILDQFSNLLDWQTGHPLADRPGIGDWLDLINSQPCRTRLLLTSRSLPLSTHRYPSTYLHEYAVQGLTKDEGIELLQKQGIQVTPQEGELIVERSQGHAFALTLLASLLHHQRLRVTTVFQNLTYARLWTGDIARNLLDVIYTEQLGDRERQLLKGFSIYREPVPLSAILALTQFPATVVSDQIFMALNTLLNQHLLQPPNEERYQLHSIVVAYIQDHFIEGDELANKQELNAWHKRAAQYYLQQPYPTREHRRKIHDVQSLIEATWHYCQAELWQQACDLMEQEGMFSDLNRWGGNAILLEICQLLLPLEKWQPTEERTVRLYNNLGGIHADLGQKERARQYYLDALNICQHTDDKRGEATALNNLGGIYADLGQKELALQHFKQALILRQTIGDRKGEGTILNNIGSIYNDFGPKEPASGYIRQALAISREVKDLGGEATALNNLGLVSASLDQKERALEYYEQALTIYKEIGDYKGQATILNNLCGIYSELGENELVFRYYMQALQCCKEGKDSIDEGRIFNNLGRFSWNIHQVEQAKGYYEQALVLHKDTGDRLWEARTLSSLGQIALFKDEKIQAQEYHLSSFRIAKEMNDHIDEATALSGLAEVSIAQGDQNQARRYYEHALYLYQELQMKEQEGIIIFQLGMIYQQQQNYPVALASFLWAQELLQDAQTLKRDMLQQALMTLRVTLGNKEYTTLFQKVQPIATQLLKQTLQQED